MTDLPLMKAQLVWIGRTLDLVITVLIFLLLGSLEQIDTSWETGIYGACFYYCFQTSR